jgi:hypothetical protein
LCGSALRRRGGLISGGGRIGRGLCSRSLCSLALRLMGWNEKK